VRAGLVSDQSADGTNCGHGRRRDYSLLSAAACQHPDQRSPELATGSEPDAPGGGQVVPAAGGVTSATQQPVLLTLTQHAMQDRLPRGLTLQDTDLAGGAPRPKRAAVHRVQYRELDLPERIASFHSSSLGPPARLPGRPGVRHGQQHPSLPRGAGSWSAAPRRSRPNESGATVEAPMACTPPLDASQLPHCEFAAPRRPAAGVRGSPAPRRWFLIGSVMQRGRERDPDDRAFLRLKPRHRLAPRLLAPVVQKDESSLA
jgi:hypothetical protein